MSSIVRGRRYAARAVAVASSVDWRPTARAIEATTSSGSPTEASGTNATVSNPASSSDATSMAGRVLPAPPGPVSVTSRAVGRTSSPRNAAASRSRPTIAVNGTGR